MSRAVRTLLQTAFVVGNLAVFACGGSSETPSVTDADGGATGNDDSSATPGLTAKPAPTATTPVSTGDSGTAGAPGDGGSAYADAATSSDAASDGSASTGNDAGDSSTAPAAPAPLSAYFGANDSAPGGAITNCTLPAGTKLVDGVPVVFPTEIDPASISLGSFAYVRNGQTYNPICAILLPATSAYSAATGYIEYDSDQKASYENRTVLTVWNADALVAGSTSPVAIVGDIKSEDDSIDYVGTTAPLIPYATGPSLELARTMTTAELPVGTDTKPSVDSECPAGTTSGALVVWQGGITVNGNELDVADMVAGYQMTIRHSDGSMETRVPDGLGDAGGDGDNDHIVCLVGDGMIVGVEVAAHTVTDPSGYWNPATKITVP